MLGADDRLAAGEPPQGKRVRVCFLIPDLADGGAQVQCLRLVDALQSRGEVEPVLIYMHDGVHSHRLTSASYRVEHVQAGSNYDPRNILRIHDRLRQLSPDLLFTWLHASDVYGFFLRKLNPRVPWLMAERDSSYPSELRYKLREALGRHADAIICNSQSGSRYWHKLKAAGPLYVVPNILPDTARNLSPVRANRVALVGRLEPQKNPLAAVRAFCRVAADRPDLQFAIVGAGSLRPDVERIIADAGLRHRFALLGFRNDAATLIASSRLVVSLSHHEGFPNVLLEAIAAGTPAVVSDIPEHREILGGSYPFYVADRDDAESCAGCIVRALSCGNETAAYGPARAILPQMSAEVVSARYAAIFKELTRK